VKIANNNDWRALPIGVPTCIAYLLFEAVDLEKKRKLPKEIFLEPWQECVGTYRGLRTSKDASAIVLSLANGQTLEIPFKRPSVEEENVLRELRDDMIGQKIGVMEVEIHQYRAGGDNR